MKDRLEIIKTKRELEGYKHGSSNYLDIHKNDWDWLIAEVERLRKAAEQVKGEG